MNPGGNLHVLYSLRAEGCPRLALALLKEAFESDGRLGGVAIASDSYTDLEPEFQKLQVPIFTLTWRRHGFARLAMNVRRLLSKIKPRGIICYTVGLHVPVAVAAKSLRIPVVLHLGNTPPVSNRSALLKIRLQMLTGKPFVTRYAACSEHVRRESIRAYGLQSDRVVTVPNGIDLIHFASGTKGKSGFDDQRDFVVGMVASLEAHKDQETLLEAMRLLKLRGSKVRLRLIGEGSKEPYLRRRAEQLGISDRVDWVGKVLNVSRELSELDLFAYSVREEEGLGIALIEALAAGVPVVASDVGACREVLGGGRYGRLVKPGSAVEWADALSSPITSAPAPLDYLSRYDIRQTARAYDALLAEG